MVEFLSEDQSQKIQWSADISPSRVILEAHLQDSQPFTELNEFAQDSTSYFAMEARSGLTWQIVIRKNLPVETF